MLKIDAFCHVLPPRYRQALLDFLGPSAETRNPWIHRPVALYDLEERFRLVEPYADYTQIISLAAPPPETLLPPDQCIAFVRLANEEMAKLVQRFPDRFFGFVASLPMHDPDAAIREAQYATRELGAVGVQIYTNVNGSSLDNERYLPLFADLAERNVPIWVHPWRTADVPDFAAEPRSRYRAWWTFGWPYETSIFMHCMVFWGLFDRFPGIKIITHHMGGFVPFAEGRLLVLSAPSGYVDPADAAARNQLRRQPAEYFRLFYADTALFGAEAATDCGLRYFGSSQVIFATDFPFGLEGGTFVLRETLRILESTPLLSELDRHAVFHTNILRLIGRTDAVT